MQFKFEEICDLVFEKKSVINDTCFILTYHCDRINTKHPHSIYVLAKYDMVLIDCF